jgi:hypothetical protein
MNVVRSLRTDSSRRSQTKAEPSTQDPSTPSSLLPLHLRPRLRQLLPDHPRPPQNPPRQDF